MKLKNKERSQIISRRIVKSLKLRLPAKYRPKIEQERRRNAKRFEKG